jgi:Na+-driven multidrug efflux pump
MRSITSGAVVGVAIGSAAAGALITAVLLVYVCKKRSKSGKAATFEMEQKL